MHPRIFGAYEEPESGSRDLAAIVMHPTSNFMGHYLISPLAERGICCLGLNSRYAGNDNVLIMERVIQDLGAGVGFLRQRGYRKIFLVGNSGGAALSAFYQAQAEQLTITRTAAGDPIDLSPADLPPVDGIVLSAAHPGRARVLEEWLDPAVIDERDPDATDPLLDLYHPEGPKPPFEAAFVEAFRTAQRARRDRIEAWVQTRLEALRARGDGAAADEAFVIYRTHADPRFIDLALDPNDRSPGSIWGNPQAVNRAANAVGRYTTLTAFMSQWSSRSQADGPDNLARTTVPILFLDHTADASAFPSTRARWLGAAGDRAQAVEIKGGDHYLRGRPDLISFSADEIARWAGSL